MKTSKCRPAEILCKDADSLTVAAAYLPPENKRSGYGSLLFVCPVCGEIHTHGTSSGFGGGDGHRVPHCDIKPHLKYDGESMILLNKLRPGWQFILQEVEDPSRAGSFPSELQKRLISRKP